MPMVPTDPQSQAEGYRFLRGSEFSAKVERARPLCIFAAGRASFDAIVNTDDADDAVAMLFDELPMAENGWDRVLCKIHLLPYRTVKGENVWRMERC